MGGAAMASLSTASGGGAISASCDAVATKDVFSSGIACVRACTSFLLVPRAGTRVGPTVLDELSMAFTA